MDSVNLSKLAVKQLTHGTNLQVARLYMNLETVLNLIQNEILPSMAHLQIPDDELSETLELAASNILQHLTSFRLTSLKG